MWSSHYRGYNNLNKLHTVISRHEKKVSHLSAFIAAKAFGQTRIDTLLNQQRCAAINQRNEEVKRKRNPEKVYSDNLLSGCKILYAAPG